MALPANGWGLRSEKTSSQMSQLDACDCPPRAVCLNHSLTPKVGLSRSGLRHIAGAMRGTLHCCCPCCICSTNKYRTLVSRPGKFGTFHVHKRHFCLFAFISLENNRPKKKKSYYAKLSMANRNKSNLLHEST